VALEAFGRPGFPRHAHLLLEDTEVPTPRHQLVGQQASAQAASMIFGVLRRKEAEARHRPCRLRKTMAEL
jgi:hypothetical protein